MADLQIANNLTRRVLSVYAGFSKSLSKELGSRGVTVNVIAPGYIDTDMTSSTYLAIRHLARLFPLLLLPLRCILYWKIGISEERKKDIISRTSLGRLGQPEDVSEAALFLAQAKFITGQVLANLEMRNSYYSSRGVLMLMNGSSLLGSYG